MDEAHDRAVNWGKDIVMDLTNEEIFLQDAYKAK